MPGLKPLALQGSHRSSPNPERSAPSALNNNDHDSNNQKHNTKMMRQMRNEGQLHAAHDLQSGSIHKVAVYKPTFPKIK